MDTIRGLLVHELNDLYDAEHQLLDAMPKMIKKADSRRLTIALDRHRVTTQEQVLRLEGIFELLGEDADRSTCKAMEGLLKEAKSIMKASDEEARDIGIISSARRIEHYELAGYSTAVALARAVGEQEVARMLQSTLDEESAADMELVSLLEERCGVRVGAEGREPLGFEA